MGKHNWINRIGYLALSALLLMPAGCAGQAEERSQAGIEAAPEEEPAGTEAAMPAEPVKEEAAPEEEPAEMEAAPEEETASPAKPEEEGNAKPPLLQQTDWEDFFGGINGSAVVYEPAENRYRIYNQEAAMTRRSPCSTFKIISSLLALESGVVDPDRSVRTWSGEIFWNEDWNRDIGFDEAFGTSCVWYFRQVIDEIGRERMQDGLDKLQYGNRDISDWEGRSNTNNRNPALTGFWIESSLKISPKEQTEVMERIFESGSGYSRETIGRLMQVMLLPESEETGILIYGKTGMGKAAGITVDAWYTGFAECAGRRVYFCVHLDETADAEVTSSKAREIAVKILEETLLSPKVIYINHIQNTI